MTTNDMYTLKKLYNKELIITSRIPKVPLYVPVYDVIYGLIKNGEIGEGEKIPTEHFFAEYLGVSRSTVRMALLILQEDGILYTQHGKGTFVANSKKDNGIHANELRLMPKDIVAAANKKYDLADGRFELIPHDDFLDSKLKPAEDEKIGLIFKRHLADGEPVAISQSYFIARGELANPDLDFKTANQIYEDLFENVDNKIQYVFIPVIPTQDKRSLLGIGSSKTLLLIRSEVMNEEKPIIFSKEFYNTNRIKVSLSSGS